MKKILSLILVLVLCLSLASCGDSTLEDKNVIGSSDNNIKNKKITITLGVPTAPPTLPILRMIETKALGENVEIKLDIWNEPETLIAMVQDGKHQLFAFPLTVISKLYNKGVDVKLMNVNTWGVTYFLTSDPDFKTWKDLKGKKVYIPLQSSPPDVLTQYFLAEAGLEVGKDVEIIYASAPEVATLLATGEAIYGTQIEPLVTKALMKNKDLHIAFDFESEWQRVNGTDSKIPNAGFGATQKFINNNPELADKFQQEYKKATQWVNENPKEIGILGEKYLGLKSQLIVKSLPKMGLNFKSATNSQDELKMLYDLLYDFNPAMIGGKVADKGLYYGEENK